MKSSRIPILSGIILILCVLAALIIIQLSNSENRESAKATVTPKAPQTPETTSTPLKGTSVTIKLGIWPSSEKADEIKLHEGYVDKLKALHPDITLVPANYQYSADSFYTMAQAGTLPTIFEGQSWIISNKRIMDSLADITDELAARGWDTAMNPSLSNILSLDGRIYGIPNEGYALGLMMNVELFKQAGLIDSNGYPLYPKTVGEFVEVSKSIKDSTGKAGFCFPAKDLTGAWHFTQIAWSFGATLVTPNEDGTFTANLDSEKAIAAMSFIKDLKWKHDVLTDDPANEDWNSGFKALGTGSAAMFIGADDAVNQPTQINGLAPEKLAMCAFPAGPKGDAYSMIGGTSYFFSKGATSDEINACLDYLEIIGKTPVISNEIKESMKKDAQNKATNRIPVISRFPCWINMDFLDAEKAILNQFSNVDTKMFEPYVSAVRGSTHILRLEEPGSGSALYLELLDVLQAVIKDSNADVSALMKKADANLQQELNGLFPK